ncbi:nucleotide exchange factor GrpE [Limosilactobacillus pontis]|uniref:Protein GrpE n=1 Tax=Limosilactobacillus pontis DSM 8475 TaxID=1423794 RepID=A0A922TGY0_9LACO|nr:nucleotide exchange factor GrpE [Limosilactobacillus pontis]KRM35308.1 heat shock protein grpe [Limosilactobacillus pontis DSM 8475]QFV00860.1 nucleotide exchange factor GrpE [Limosilactobacillus pontis]
MAEKDNKKTAEQQPTAEEQVAAKKTTNAQSKDKKKSATSQVDELKAEIKDLKQQLADKDDKYLRAEAEIQNMTTRFKKERAQILKYDGQDLAKAVLPVLDNLKRALTIEVTDENGKQLKKGIQMVHDHLTSALTDHGITEIEADGKPFDPTLHQAVQTVPAQDGQKPDTVVQVLQAGYQLKDRVLRPAMVVVAQ